MSTRSHAGQTDGIRAALVPLPAALRLLLAGLSPVDAQAVPVEDALGFVLAEDAVVPADVPPVAVALRAGAAVRALETVGAGPYSPAPLLAGAHPLDAGDALPAGCDAVLPVDAIDRDGPFPLAVAAASPGEMVRRVGEDARAGAVMARTGTRLTAVACAAMAATGIGRVAVRVPRLRLDGDLRAPAAALLSAVAARRGVSIVGPGAAADLVACLGSAFDEGSETLARGIALRPGGEEMAVGRTGGEPAVLIPPRPEAVLACWVALLLPAVERLSGAGTAMQAVVLAGKAASTAGFADLVLVRPAETDPDRWEVLAVGDVPWSRLAAATAAGLVEPDSEGLPPGATMPVMLL